MPQGEHLGKGLLLRALLDTVLGAAEAQRGGLRADVETISGAIASGRIPSTKVPHRGAKGQAHGGDPVYSSWEAGEASGGADQLLVIDMTKPTPV